MEKRKEVKETVQPRKLKLGIATMAAAFPLPHSSKK
jgi:hypothetical protein